MSPAETIESALRKGSQDGIASLSPLERTVWLISEAEVNCDINGIDSFLDIYNGSLLLDAADSFEKVGGLEISQTLRAIHATFPERPDHLLDRAEKLIAARDGYDYDAILKFVSTGA